MSPPSIEEIQAEAEWIDEMINRTMQRSKSSDCNLKQFLHLEACRAELQAYRAGLLFALGYPEMLDHHSIVYELNLSERTDDETTRSMTVVAPAVGTGLWRRCDTSCAVIPATTAPFIAS